MTTQTIAPRELRNFIKEYADDYCAVSLLLFFSAYPLTRFSRLAIVHALNPDNSTNHVHRALEKLVDKGVINTRVDNNTTLYWLGDNSTTRRLVLQFGKLAMSHRQLFLRHVSSCPLRTEQPFARLPARFSTAPTVS